MTYPLRIALAVVLLVPALHAQPSRFEPGYVVLEGVRTPAWVALSTEIENARRVTYRLSPDGPEHTAVPFQLEGYGVDGGREYRTGIWRVQAPGYEDVTVDRVLEGFARVVRDGDADLLALEVADRRPVFFVEVDGETVGLYHVERGGGVMRLSSVLPLYRQALLMTLGDCAGPEDAYARLAYSEAALVERVDAYNACSDPDYRAPAVTRGYRPQVVGVEVGGGYAAGTFSRRVRAGAFDEPAQSTPYVRATATVTPPSAPWASLVLEADYAPRVVSVGRWRTGPDYVVSISTATIGIGVRASQSVSGFETHVGAGLLGGTTFQRVTNDAVDLATLGSTVLRSVNLDRMTSTGGQYAEVGIRSARVPLVLTVRAQQTVYGPGSFHMPPMQTYDYKHNTVTVGLGWRVR